MGDYRYDMVVIGSGPAGEGAATRAAKQGKSVAVVDLRPQVGGHCTHLGTIPSKALRHAVRRIMQYNSMPLFRVVGEPRWFSFPEVMETAAQVIQKQVQGRVKYFSRARVKMHVGHASFIEPHRLQVVKGNGTIDFVEADHFVIATGSHPYTPPDVDFSRPNLYTSDTIINMKDTPKNIIIYGAGVIGCEYASIFAGLEVKVDLVNTRQRLLEFLDDEISDALSYHLRDLSVMVRHNEECRKVTADGNGVLLELKSGKRIRADALLWCNGRTGNTAGLGLENIGLQPDHRGQLAVNRHYQTEIDHVYAVGDVIGWPSLAGAAYDQGRFAAIHLCGDGNGGRVENVATGIYTIPEISYVGKTERELTEAQIPYEVGRAFFKNIARAQISGEEVGELKILFHTETLAILGVHCFGAEAAEIVHIGQAIMNQPGEANTIEYFTRTTFNYPTMAEAYRRAAINGLERVDRVR